MRVDDVESLPADQRGETEDQPWVVGAAGRHFVDRHPDGACGREEGRFAAVVGSSKQPEVHVEARMIDGPERFENSLARPTDFVGVAQVEDLDAAHGIVAPGSRDVRRRALRAARRCSSLSR